MRKIILSVMMVMILCVSAWADIVYTTDAGNMGLIKIRGADSVDLRGTQYTGAADSFLGSYWNGSDTRVILVDRTTDPAASGDTALVFNPSNLTNPIDSTRKILEGVYDTRTVINSRNGRGLFFASGSSIHEFSTGDLSFTRSYTYKPKTSEDIAPQITNIIVSYNVIYALGEREDSSDVVLIFDGQLRDDIEDFTSITLPHQTHSLTWLRNWRLAAAHDYGVDIINNRQSTRLVSSDYPVRSICEDEGDGCYFVEQTQSDDTYITTLKHYTSSGVTALYTDDTGSACSVMRDENNGLLGAVIGSRILVYKTNDDSLVREYDSASLGGLPTYIAMSYVNGDDNSSSSGCNISSAGMLLLLSLMLLKRR